MHLLFFDNEDRNDQVKSSGVMTKTFEQGLALWEKHHSPKVESNVTESDKDNFRNSAAVNQICHCEIVRYNAIYK